MSLRLSACAAALVAAACVVSLGGCASSSPSTAGVWRSSTGAAAATISDDGNCTNMLYQGSELVALRAPGMCQIVDSRGGDSFTLRVAQAPYSYDYTATFSDGGGTMRLARNGRDDVTLTRVPGSH